MTRKSKYERPDENAPPPDPSEFGDIDITEENYAERVDEAQAIMDDFSKMRKGSLQTKDCGFCQLSMKWDDKVCPHCGKEQTRPGCIAWALMLFVIISMIVFYLSAGFMH